MKLVIAEKPSVANALAKVLGAAEHGDGCLKGNGYYVSWCIGHLVELSPPEAYNETYVKWRAEDLPILPEHWRYQISASTKKQFRILKELMGQNDVESLICATDAGREGELIFRLVYTQAECKKPFQRLWISSMEDRAIREGFAHLEPSEKYDALYEAALCRERADWIVGMNATRLFSCLYWQTLNVGRVMTPTLAMVTARDAEINAFSPLPFHTVQLNFPGGSAASRRFEKKEEAEALLEADLRGFINSGSRKDRKKFSTDERPFQLLIDIQSKLQSKSAAYQRWATVFNLKQMSKTLLYLRDHQIESRAQLDEKVKALVAQRDAALASVMDSEKRLTEISELKKHIITYAKTRAIYEEYRRSGYSKAYLKAHHEDIALHKAAKAAFDELAMKKIPKVKELSTEFAEVLAGKRQSYSEYLQVKDEAKELLIAQRNIAALYEAEKKEENRKEQDAKSH